MKLAAVEVDPEEGGELTPRLARWRRRTDLPLVILAIGSLPLLALETARSELPRHDRLSLDVVNLEILVAFAVDYVAELWLVEDRRSFLRHEWIAALLVVTQALALLPALAAFGVFRVLRAGRAARILVVAARLVAVTGYAAREGRSILRRRAASFALGLAGFTWVTSAVLFTLVEDVGRAGRREACFDAVGWATTTVTTVGYGDVYPVTAAGRLIGGFTMVVGISTFAIVTAKVAEFLVRSDPSSEVDGAS